MVRTDNKGTYVVRVYRQGDDGTPRLEATEELTLAEHLERSVTGEVPVGTTY